MNPPSIDYWAPLPPARTGVADYAASLLAALRRFTTVAVNGTTSRTALYHLGNNHLHRDIYYAALQRPGVAVLHDAVMHHFHLGAMPREQYIAEFTHQYGEWNRSLAADLWNARARSAADARYFEWPMLRRIAERSLAVVVHNPAAAAAVRRHAPAARVVEIPHLYEEPAAPPPARPIERRECRRFAVFGFLRESKRVLPVLRVFERLRRRWPRLTLQLAGECVSADLEKALHPWASLPGVVRDGFLEGAAFEQALAAADAVINLRYPAAGETSGIAIRAMGAGRCVLLSNALENSRYPETACLRVDTGPAEEAMLAAELEWLASDPSAHNEIGLRARRHILAEHSLELAAARYWELLRETAT